MVSISTFSAGDSRDSSRYVLPRPASFTESLKDPARASVCVFSVIDLQNWLQEFEPRDRAALAHVAG